jgi:hypothetical protein
MSCGSIPRRLPAEKILVLSFPHAFSGNPGETPIGPPIKTFEGDTFWKNYYRGILIRRRVLWLFYVSGDMPFFLSSSTALGVFCSEPIPMPLRM